MSNVSTNFYDLNHDGNPRPDRFQNRKTKMKNLIFMSYKQPNENPAKFRWGVVEGTRDLKREPLTTETLQGYYRYGDPLFKRTQHLTTVKTTDGIKAFYRERTNWKIEIPFVGSLVSRFLPA